MGISRLFPRRASRLVMWFTGTGARSQRAMPPLVFLLGVLGFVAVGLRSLSLVLGLILLLGLLAWILTDPLSAMLVWFVLLMPQWLLVTKAGSQMMQAPIGGIAVGSLLSWIVIAGCFLRLLRNGLPSGIPSGFGVYAALVGTYIVALPLGLLNFGADALYSAMRILGPAVVGVFVASECRRHPDRLRLITLSLCLSVLLMVAYTVVSDWSNLFVGHASEGTALLGWPSSVGYFCAVSLAFLSPAALLRHAYGRVYGVAVRVAMAAAAYGVIVSGSRGAWIALLAVSFILALLGSRSAVGIALILVAGVLLLPALNGRVTLLIEHLAISSPDTGSGRVQIWTIVWGLVRQELLLGHGAGSYFTNSRSLFAGTLTESFPHSDFLFLWYEVGVLGPLLLLGVRVRWLADGIRRALDRKLTPAGRGLWGGVAAAAVGVSIGHLIDNVLFVSAIQMVVAILVASIWGATAGEGKTIIQNGTPPILGSSA